MNKLSFISNSFIRRCCGRHFSNSIMQQRQQRQQQHLLLPLTTSTVIHHHRQISTPSLLSSTTMTSTMTTTDITGGTNTTTSNTRLLYSPIRKFSSSNHNNVDTEKRKINDFLSIMNHRKGSVLTEDLDSYNQDWTNRWKGNASIVLRPNSTKEVSEILKYCSLHKIPLVPQGGNTGLVGGSVPSSSGEEIIVSLQLLNQIESFDNNTGILVCQSGCILQDIQEFAEDRDHIVPLDIGAKGSCMIGGNVATKAGGQYFARHGSLHATILGMEVVMADGTILDLCNTNLKDNTGYDLKHLFIGSEGTLGIITKLVILCPILPLSRQAVWLACQSYQDVLMTMELAKVQLGEILGAFEFMDKEVLDLAVMDDQKIPLVVSSDNDDENINYPYSVLLETQGSNVEHDREKIEAFVESAMEEEYVVDGLIAQDQKQFNELWALREHFGVAVTSMGRPYKYDISLPVNKFEFVIQELRSKLENKYQGEEQQPLFVNWGHILDGNLHLNIVIPGKFERDESLQSFLEKNIVESVIEQGGSISAEHGIGVDKVQYIPRIKSPEVLQTMQSIKKLFDPHNILNPNKVLPPSS